MKIKYFLMLVLLAGLLIAGWLWLYLNERTDRNVYDAVPAETLLIFESTGGDGFWTKIQSETALYASLSEMDFMRSFQLNLSSLDTLLGKRAGSFYDFMKSQPLLLYLLPVKNQQAWVITAQLSDKIRMYEIPELAGRAFGNRVEIVARKTYGIPTALLVDKSTGLQLHYTITGGLFIGSFNKDGFEKAVKQLGEKSGLLMNTAFANLRDTRGGFVDGYLFLNNELLSGFLQQQLAAEYQQLVSKAAGQFESWTVFDISVRNANIVQNGFTQPKEGSFLKALSNTQVVENKCFNVLPFNTRTLFQIAIPEFPLFYKQNFNQAGLITLSQQTGVDMESLLINRIDSEIAIARIQKSDATADVFLCRINEAAVLEQQLRLLSKTLTNSRNIPDGSIFNLGADHIVAMLFGQAFEAVKGSWVALTDQFLLIANDSSTLELILKLHQRGRVMTSSEHFRQFSNNLADASNMLIYANIREGLPVLNSFFGKNLSFHINRNQQTIRAFEAVAIQLSATGSMMYTSCVLKHNPDYKEESMIGWKFKLDAPGALKPFVVSDKRSKSSRIAVVDNNNTMYMLSANGELLWKKALQDLPLSDIYVIELQKSNQEFLLFNTPTHIHLTDMNGRPASGFPVRLRSEATNGLLLVDYDGRKEYRLLVACSDRIIYNYDLSGRMTEGWELPRTNDIVAQRLEYFKTAGSDYLVSVDLQGDIRVFDRRGVSRITARGQYSKASRSSVFLNQTNSKGVLLTTSSDGKILYISGTGLLSSTDFGYFSPEHFFLYEDFNQNRSVDFIWLDGKELKVFDRFQQLLFQYVFKNSIDNKPYFQQLGRNKLLIVSDNEAGEVYMFDKEGKSIIASGLPLQQHYTLANLFNSDEISVLTIVDNQLIHYQVY